MLTACWATKAWPTHDRPRRAGVLPPLMTCGRPRDVAGERPTVPTIFTNSAPGRLQQCGPSRALGNRVTNPAFGTPWHSRSVPSEGPVGALGTGRSMVRWQPPLAAPAAQGWDGPERNERALHATSGSILCRPACERLRVSGVHGSLRHRLEGRPCRAAPAERCRSGSHGRRDHVRRAGPSPRVCGARRRCGRPAP